MLEEGSSSAACGDAVVVGAVPPGVLGDEVTWPLMQRPAACSAATACAAVFELAASSAANSVLLEAVSATPCAGEAADASVGEERKAASSDPVGEERTAASSDPAHATRPSVGEERKVASSDPGGAVGAATGVASAEQPTWGGEREAAPP